MAEVIRMGQEPNAADELRRQWGERIAKRRELRGLTQQALADLMAKRDCPVTAQAISEWERGKAAPRWHHQFALAASLGCEHGDIFRPAAA